MAALPPDEMRRFWNERAREDALYFVDNRREYRGPESPEFWEVAADLDAMLDALGVALRPEDTVLEIGCGVGRVTRVLAERVRSVIALDVSDEMLERARSFNPGLDSVEWMLGDGMSLAGVDDESVDACVSTVVFQHLPDARIALSYVHEVGRILKPGGWAALQVSNDPAIHRRRAGLRWRLKATLGRAPGGQSHPAWLGSAVSLPELRRAAGQGGAIVETVWGEGSQYCSVLLRKTTLPVP